MGTVAAIRRSRPTHALAAESHMEAGEAARRVLAFTEDELRESFQNGDVRRLRRLQAVHRDAKAIMAEHRRQAGWHDSLACADGVSAPSHGRAA
jgi:hypothetical protein